MWYFTPMSDWGIPWAFFLVPLFFLTVMFLAVVVLQAAVDVPNSNIQ